MSRACRSVSWPATTMDAAVPWRGNEVSRPLPALAHVAGRAAVRSADSGLTVRDLAEYDSSTGDTTVVNHIVYDAFGRIVSETDAAIAFLYGFTGRERDIESDLQYNRARYYDAALGRWLSQDPIGFDSGDANLYRYVGNFAVAGSDPSGLLEADAYVPYEYDTITNSYFFSIPRIFPEPIERFLDELREELANKFGRLFVVITYGTRCVNGVPMIDFDTARVRVGFPLLQGEVDINQLVNSFSKGPFTFTVKTDVRITGADVVTRDDGTRVLRYLLHAKVYWSLTIGTGIGTLPGIDIKEWEAVTINEFRKAIDIPICAARK
jgi:RHS repeat-associated protein